MFRVEPCSIWGCEDCILGWSLWVLVLHKSWWFVGLYAEFEGFLWVSISSSAGIEFCFWQLGLSSMARIRGTNLVAAVDLCVWRLSPIQWRLLPLYLLEFCGFKGFCSNCYVFEMAGVFEVRFVNLLAYWTFVRVALVHASNMHKNTLILQVWSLTPHYTCIHDSPLNR